MDTVRYNVSDPMSGYNEIQSLLNAMNLALDTMRYNVSDPMSGYNGYEWVALPTIMAVGEKVSKARPHISITTMIHRKNSSDLAMGRRPELKSDEISLWIILVVKIFKI